MLRLLAQLLLVFLVTGAVTSPEECEEWFSGYTYTIEWEADSFDTSTVTIGLYEGLESLVDEIAKDVPNTGEYNWLVPFYEASTECSIIGIYIRVISPDHDSESETFAITNPVQWGSANNFAQYNVADTLFKVRWTGPKVPMYEIAYRLVGAQNSVEYITHPSDRRNGEDLDEEVISGLEPATDYEFRLRYNRTSNSAPSEWTDWVQVTTFERLECTDELLSAWFALEVYDNIRTGDQKYPNFCGNWITTFAYSSTSDFVAVFSENDSGRMIVAFRGTEGDNFEDAIDNIGALADCKKFMSEVDDSECEISSGFGSNYVYSAIQKIHHVIEEAIRDGFDKLIVTGHSQGGALATVAALDYATVFEGQIPVDLISFGAPEVGNEAFSDLVTEKMNSILRIVQKDENGEEDEVAGLPTSILPTDIGFVQLNEAATYYFCPLACREDGVFITSPFYCHCIEGYWTTTATNNEQSGYFFNSLLNNVASGWYTDSGFEYSTQSVSVVTLSFFSSSPSTNNNNSPSSNNNNSPSSNNNNSPSSNNNNSPSSNGSSALTIIYPILLLVVLALL